LQALNEAKVIAQQIGPVLVSTGNRGAVYDMVLFSPHCVIFVRVKRTRRELSVLEDINAECRREITRFRSVPANGFVHGELWVRSPKGSWQYFFVAGDVLAEVLRDQPRRTGDRPAEENDVEIFPLGRGRDQETAVVVTNLINP
jgi:hypothetical protein